MAGIFFNVKQLPDALIRQPQELQQGTGISQLSLIGKSTNRILDQSAIPHHPNGDKRVQVRPQGFGVQKGDTAKRHPAACLCPDHAADDVFSLTKLARILLVEPAGEARILATAFILTPSLQLHDLGQRRTEEIPVQGQVTKKIRLPILHRHDERGAGQSVEHPRESIAMPHQIADRISSHRPCPENHPPAMLFKHGQQGLKKGPCISGCLDDKLAVKIILHILAIRLADAHDHSGDLRKINEETVQQVAQVLIHRGSV